MSFRRRKIPKLIPLISLIILLTLIPLIISFLQNARGVEAAWVDDNFSYRNAIPITSHTAAENNVYVSATIDTSASGQFQADCGDLRFTNVGGDILPYYIVSGCVSASTVVHVFFKSMPAGAQALYYYYGNPSAANGFSSSDFATVASSYAVGSTGSQEKGGSPIAYWKFDDGTGTNAQDSSPNNNDGTITGATWQTEDQCISGKCLYFDEAGDNVNLGGNDNLTNNINDITIGAWVRLNAKLGTVNNNYEIISNESFQNYGYLFRVENTTSTSTAGKIHLRFSQAAAYTAITAPSNTYPDDHQWHYLVGVKEGSAGRIYLDGKLVYSASGLSNPVNASTSTYIGGNGQLWNGFLDDVKVYNYARTAAQIKSDFKSRGTAKGISVGAGSSRQNSDALSNGLVGYWKMDEASWNGTAGEVIDSSGNGNNGTSNCGGTCSKPTTGSGKFGNGGVFDGVDDYVGISYTNPTTATSVVAWFKRSGTPAGGYHIITGGADVEISINEAGNYIRTGVTTATQGRQVFNSGSGLVDGNWHQVALTYDGSSLKSFIDGAQTASNPVSGSLSGTATEIGRFLSNSYAANGKIDEVRIYNRALSPREVRDLYAWAPGPVGYWNFEEQNGGNANDISGNGYTGTNTGTTAVAGKYGKSRNFDGVANKVAVASTIAGSQTVEAWIYPTSTTSNILQLTASAYISASSGTLSATGFTSPTIYVNGVVSSTIIANQWQHVTVTTGTAISANAINFGLANSVYYSGKIDDVRIYNYARTQKQIVEDMNASHPAGGSPVGSQVAYYRFDEGQGSTTNNSGNGSGLNGTITGTTWNNNGKYAKALGFSGTFGDYVTMPAITSLTTGLPFTISVWVNPESTATYKTIIGYDGTHRLLIDSNGKLLSQQDTNFFSNANGDIPNNSWTYVAYVFTGTEEIWYVNGKQSGSSHTTALAEWNAAYKVGQYDLANYPYKGLIDELKIYSSALTSDEIQLDYNRGSAMVLGTLSDTSGLTGGSVASSSASAIYCVPGSTDTCSPPVGEWNFEEGSGNANDSSGNGFTGTNTGTTFVSGKLGKARGFNGSSDKITVSDISSKLNLISATPPSFTLEGWFYPQSGGQALGGIQLLSSSHARLIYRSDLNRFTFQLRPGENAVSNTSSPINSWYHAVGIYNSGTTTMSLYINGTFIGSATPTSIDLSGASGTPIIGNAQQYFSGKIDGVKIYNYARTPAQIAWDYNQGKPVGHWRMDECQGSTVKDSSANGNNGTITIGGSGTQTAVGTCTTSGTAWYNGVTGKFNSSLNFDGTDDYVSMGNTQDMTSNTFALSAWIKTTANNASGGYWQIAGKGNTGSGQRYTLTQSTSTNKAGFLVSNGTANNWPLSTNAINDGNWHHLVGIQNGNTTSLYVDGVLNNTDSTNTITTVSNSNAFTIGARYVPDSYFSGQIDDVRIYNYALTASQVKNLFNGGAAVKFAPLTGSP